MRPEDSAYPRDWLGIAEKDLHRVSACLAAGDPELAGFCLQQAVEKFFKAFLLHSGWTLRRTHDLEALLDDAVTYSPDWEQYRPVCQRITKFYNLSRYPLLVASAPAAEEIRESESALQPLLAEIREALG